ncbi:methyltransferase domain-containing protein [bacterium]|nr:methyltransferase domain-containing protein [bacterium]
MDAYEIMENELRKLPVPPESFLEIGSGSGYELAKLAQKFNARGTGIDPYASEYLSANIEILKKSAEKIDTIHKWFDVVFSIRSFHHLDKPQICTKKLKSVTGWKGRCFLIDYHKGAQTGFIEHYYSIDEAAAIIENSGLNILEKKCIDDLFVISATLNRWKIAVASNIDRETIFPKMFGQAPLFAIYTFSPDTGFELSEFRKNIFEKTLQHQKTFDVYNLVNDCQAVVSAKIGKKGIERLNQLGVSLFFNQGSIKHALKDTAFTL